MAKVKTPDGKYEYDDQDPAQIGPIAELYEPSAEEKQKRAEHAARIARGESVDDAKADAKAEPDAEKPAEKPADKPKDTKHA